MEADNHTESIDPYLPIQPDGEEDEQRNDDLTITTTIPGVAIITMAPSFSKEEISTSIELKKETASSSIGQTPIHIRLTTKEDQYLKKELKSMD